MRMKSIWRAIWLLSSLLVILSLDPAPDPPAVKPYSVSVEASTIRDGIGSFGEPHLHGAPLNASAHLYVRFLTFTSDHKPNRPGELVVLTGQAADSSPPSAQSHTLLPVYRLDPVGTPDRMTQRFR
jgi:hypothetical protein